LKYTLAIRKMAMKMEMKNCLVLEASRKLSSKDSAVERKRTRDCHQ
jgi:hypothetical protein